MCSDLVVQARDLGKCYHLYDKPPDRLKQLLFSGMRRLAPGLMLPPWRTRDFCRRFWALRHFDVVVRRGETVGIVGRNGSGKSTLLQLICGIGQPTEGAVVTHGRVAALLELGAGFNGEYTGRENVHLNAAIHGLTATQLEERLPAIVEFAEISDYFEQPVKTYSSGMFVRLAFSVIAHVDPDILIIDEALSVGDAYFQQKCNRFLQSFRKKGTILFVSHDLGAVMNLCDRALWLERGQLRDEGVPRMICEEYTAELYREHTGAKVHAVGTPEAPRLPDVDVPGVVDQVPDVGSATFDNSSRRFGDGAADITHVALNLENGAPVLHCIGGERVELEVRWLARRAMTSPIVGFIVKDRLGQYVFGDNTFATSGMADVEVPTGGTYRARFCFVMPNLKPGVYVVVASVASGTPDDHVQHQWIHDAILFTVRSDRRTDVLFYVPMRVAELTEIREEEMAL